jgi:stress-induced morphogen
MNDFKFVEDIIKARLPDSVVMVEDLTGTKDHLAITVVSDEFKNIPLFKQHQILMELLKEELKSRIHAVKLNTYSKEKFQMINKG